MCKTLVKGEFMAGWSKMKDGSAVNCIENSQIIDSKRNGGLFDDGDGCSTLGFAELDHMSTGESDSMIGWPNSKDGSGGDGIENCCANESNACCIDDDDDKEGDEVVDEKSRGVFDQVLMVLLRGVYAKNGVKPVPALLGDGKELDLFKLFCLVRECGGFDSVSNGKTWGVIAENCGYDSKVSAALKLIHFKYLNELDVWLNRIDKARVSGNGGYQCSGNMALMSIELDKIVRDFSKKGRESAKKDEKSIPMSFDETGEPRLKLHENLDITTSDGDENMCIGDKGDVGLGQHLADNNASSSKRKRDMLSEMHSWVIRVAKDPYNPSIGRIPEPSKWKECGSSGLLSWVLWAREATMRRRYGDSKEQESPSPLQQKKLKMHPSMYEDPVAGLRCSKRLPPNVKKTLSSCSDTLSLIKTKTLKLSEIQEPVKVASAAQEPVDVPSCDDLPIEKHVPIGSLFQAVVPLWTGAIHDCDPKWLGTKTWPPDNHNQDQLVVTFQLGKGRSESCGCHFPGSVGCVRFHIAEERMKLKLELGLVFYKWKFDQMGEEISLSWSSEEEKRFKKVMKLNIGSMGKSYLPKKMRRELVSYYYNVFVLQRRSYQNRVTPRDIDSDDDESELGSVGGPFGHEAIKVGGLELLSCAKNEECFDLEL